jgi:aminopeptidase N
MSRTTSSFRKLLAVLCSLVLLLSVGCQALPLPSRPIATAAPAPTATPPATPTWQLADTYRAAMLATAADDVQSIESPTYYHIRARVEFQEGVPRLDVVQDTRYTNHTDAPLEAIYFRLFPNKPSFGSELRFSQVTVEGDDVELENQAEGTAVGVPLPRPLPPGESTEIHMEYEVTVPVDNARGYGTFNYQDGILLLSNFYAMVAVYEESGWNLSLAPDYGDPGYAETSFFTVEMTAPQQAVVICSGSVFDKQQNDDGTTTWTCLSGPMRDFMVVISERFESSSLAVGFVRVNSYYLPEHRTAGEQVLLYARDSLRAFQQSLGIYPFAEFDVVEAPIFAGGMEYPSLILIGEQYYAQVGESLEFVVTHEVAHQWWYSLVGNDQVNDPWLDESLANFSIVYYYENTYDRNRADLAFQQFVQQRYEQIRGTERDVAVAQPVAAFAPNDYGPVVYGKGAMFFYTLREELGETLFLDVLRAYLQDRRYKLSKAEDFLRVAEQVSGQELDSLYNQWILNQP